MSQGRPTDYTEEMASAICDLLAQGISLRKICEMEEMPGRTTVFQWLNKQPSFANQYAHAREAQAETMLEELLEIADNGENDYVTRVNDDGSESKTVDHDHIARSRLRVDTRKWAMSKMLPKKYGEKLDIAHQGGVTLTLLKADEGL